MIHDDRQIPKVLHSINQFSKATGLKLNIDKHEIFALHDQLAHSICNTVVKTQIKYLGIIITKKIEERRYKGERECL